jgi:hypothetical protein
MYQKSLVVISAVIVIGLFLIVFLFDNQQPQETLVEGEQYYSIEAEPMPAKTINKGEPEVADEAEVIDPMPQAKINVRVACESALMYTTFTDGDAAEAYVEECVDGKHPDVIERYISDMGVDGAVI